MINETDLGFEKFKVTFCRESCVFSKPLTKILLVQTSKSIPYVVKYVISCVFLTAILSYDNNFKTVKESSFLTPSTVLLVGKIFKSVKGKIKVL